MKPLLKASIIAVFAMSLNLSLHNFSPGKANPPSSSENLTSVETAKKHYHQGEYSQAVEYLQKAVKNYQTNGEIANEIQALSWLSLAQQKLGHWQEAEITINTCISLLKNNPEINPVIKAQVYNTAAHLQAIKGNEEAALSSWQNAGILYEQVGDKLGIIGSKINQAQALEKLGLYHQTEQILTEVEKTVFTITDQELQVRSLYNLGEFFTKKGNLIKAQYFLEKSLVIAQKLNNPDLQSKILLTLGNTEYSLAKTALNYGQNDSASETLTKAREYYQQAAKITPVNLTKIQAQNNEINLVINLVGKPSRKIAYLQELLPQIKQSLSYENTGRESIYNQVNLVNNLMKIDYKELGISDRDLGQTLGKAVQKARELEDIRAESETLGTLAKLYQKTGQIDQALELTKQALITAQKIDAEDIAVRYWSLLGQINQQKGNKEEAIKAYNRSISILKKLRSELVGFNQDLQFSFRDGIEPIYREYVDLLLTDNPSQENLQKAREAIEGLQLAELDNFFKEACLIARPKQIEQIDKNAAVIYPIILPNRLAVIAYLPGDNLKYYHTDLGEKEIEEIISKTKSSLSPISSQTERLNLSKTIYNWLIKDVENELKDHQIKTLVFVLDGDLRSLPMSMLHDGEKYLVEKYSIALSPGLQLLPPKSLTQEQFKLLIGAISEARQGFSPLPSVKDEVKNLSAQFVNQKFVDEQFTTKNFQELINKIPFPVVHLATHGQFSSNPDETFILTWNDKLKINQLEQLIKGREKNKIAPIELLVLSACQTASGDKRASLGLAGLAVKSGVRSTLASLWSVNDEATAKLIFEFYQQLSKGVNKAEALRLAQIKLLNIPEYNHPAYWSAFVLVGNWL
jgi:CHAT domain-containing protein/TPR repeat protein